MAISNDEPDIIVGGGDPSAPPIATAVPASATAFNNNNPNSNNKNKNNPNIERTTNADGSLIVKATTTTRQPNGYRNVTIEYFYVPANMVGTVTTSMDATGEPPSSLYMTKMEQQVLPPGTGEVVSHAPVTAGVTGGAGGGGGGNAFPQPYTHQHTAVAGGSPSGGRGACIGVTVCVIIAIAGIAGAVNNTNNHYWPTPAPYSAWNPPSPWNPSPPTPNPTRDGCKDTPDWVDDYGRDCEYYSRSFKSIASGATGIDRCRDRISWLFEGPMGPATENCCTCGGGSTYAAPTPGPSRAPIVSPPPSPRPTQSPACEDTPGWKDSRSNGCEFYSSSSSSFRCDFSADIYKGDMGSATDNCCACGGGEDPSTSTSKAPATATSDTPVPSITPPNLAAVPTLELESKGVLRQSEKHLNLSNTNPFKSPTAAVAKEE